MAGNKKDDAVERLLNADKKEYTDKKKDPGKAESGQNQRWRPCRRPGHDSPGSGISSVET